MTSVKMCSHFLKINTGAETIKPPHPCRCRSASLPSYPSEELQNIIAELWPFASGPEGPCGHPHDRNKQQADGHHQRFRDKDGPEEHQVEHDREDGCRPHPVLLQTAIALAHVVLRRFILRHRYLRCRE